MGDRTEMCAEEALIVIILACAGADQVRAFMQCARIQPARNASAATAILAHYRTRRGYDLRRFAADLDSLASDTEIAA